MNKLQYSNPIYTYGFIGDYNIFSPLYRSFNGMPMITYILLGGTTALLAYLTLLNKEPSIQSNNQSYTILGGCKKKSNTIKRKNNKNNKTKKLN